MIEVSDSSVEAVEPGKPVVKRERKGTKEEKQTSLVPAMNREKKEEPKAVDLVPAMNRKKKEEQKAVEEEKHMLPIVEYEETNEPDHADDHASVLQGLQCSCKSCKDRPGCFQALT